MASATDIRIIAAILLFILTIFTGVLPPVLFKKWRQKKIAQEFSSIDKNHQTRRWFNYKNIMDIFMFFGGGILLATCFCHLIPEVREDWNRYLKSEKQHENNHSKSHDELASHDHKHSLPHVELSVCFGFFVIYLLEELIHTFVGHHHQTNENDADESVAGESSQSHADYDMESYCETITDSGNCSPVVSSENIMSSTPGIIFEKTLQSSISNTSRKDKKLPRKSMRFVQGLVVIVAFSAHSVFDGVAVGLQEQSSRIWTTFFAICSHKLVVSFAVGMQLFEKTQSMRVTAGLMSLFSIMSPVGIFIVLLSESYVSGNQSPFMILLSAVATGTILYIVFFEILQRDQDHEKMGQPPPKLFGLFLYTSMLVGFLFMLLLTVLL